MTRDEPTVGATTPAGAVPGAPADPPARIRMATYWAVGLAVAASAYILFSGPLVWQVLIPIAIAVTPLPKPGGRERHRVRVAALVLMIAFVVLAAPSIGLFYVPSAIALGIASMSYRQTTAG